MTTPLAKTLPFNSAPIGPATKEIPTSISFGSAPIDPSSSVRDVIAQHNADTTPPPIPSAYDTAMGKTDTTPGIIPQVVDQFKQGYEQTKTGANNKDLVSGLEQIGRGTLNEAAAGIREVFSPVEAGLNVVSKLPGFHEALGALKDFVINPIADKASDIPAVQKFMQSNPHADEVFGNLATIVGSLVGGKEAPEIKTVLSEAGAKGADAISTTLDKTGEVASTVKDATGNIVKNIPGTEIPGKIIRRGESAVNSTIETAKLPPEVKTAVKADIPSPQATLIHEANPAEKTLMTDMLNKQESGVKNLVMKPEERPDAVIGTQITKAIKFLNDQKKSAIIEEGNHVTNLAGEPVDYSRTVGAFKDRLSMLGIKEGEKGRLDFSNSELSTPASAKDRGLLQLTYDELKSNQDGEFTKSADELHLIRQRLFNETQGKNFTEPFSDRIVNMVHNDEGTSVRSGLLHDISDQTGPSGKGYQATATKNAEIQNTLQTIGKLLGKDNGGKSLDIQNLKAGEVANRLQGNASAVVENALQKLEDTAKKYGYTSDVSIRKLVAFKTILKNIVGETQHNSLAGGIEQGVKAVLPDAFDAVGHVSSGNIVGAVKSVGKFIKSNTTAEQVRALRGLLQSKKPDVPF